MPDAGYAPAKAAQINETVQIIFICIRGMPELGASEIDVTLPPQMIDAPCAISMDTLVVKPGMAQSDILLAARAVKTEAEAAELTPYQQPYARDDMTADQAWSLFLQACRRERAAGKRL